MFDRISTVFPAVKVRGMPRKTKTHKINRYSRRLKQRHVIRGKNRRRKKSLSGALPLARAGRKSSALIVLSACSPSLSNQSIFNSQPVKTHYERVKMLAAVTLIPGACLSALPVRLACQCALTVFVKSNQTIDHISPAEISRAVLPLLTSKAASNRGKAYTSSQELRRWECFLKFKLIIRV